MGAGFNSHHLERLNIVPLADPGVIQRCRLEVRQMRGAGCSEYIVDIGRKTRTHPTIIYGASPRAHRSLYSLFEALRRDPRPRLSTPDDVRDVALPVLRPDSRSAPRPSCEGASNERSDQ